MQGAGTPGNHKQYNRTRSPNVPARHFTVPNSRSSTECSDSKLPKHPIPSAHCTDRSYCLTVGRQLALCTSTYPKSRTTFWVDVFKQARRNRPGRASSVETRAGGTARRPPIKTALDRPLAWTAIDGVWERILGGEKSSDNESACMPGSPVMRQTLPFSR